MSLYSVLGSTALGGMWITLLVVILLAGGSANATVFEAASLTSRRALNDNVVPCISHGEPAPPNRLPYAVSLRKKGGNEHFCTGTLLDKDWVMTAAHCVDGTGEDSEPYPLVYINDSSAEGVKHRVTAMTIHPSWKGFPGGADIAMLKMESPVEGVPQPLLHNPIILNLVPSEILSIVGFRIGGVLEFGDVMLLENTACQMSFNDMTISEEMVCTGGVEGPVPSMTVPCPGDSGGPLLFLDAPEFKLPGGEPEKDYVVGIVSYGPKPSVQTPSIYTRVSSFTEWVIGVMNGTVICPHGAEAEPSIESVFMLLDCGDTEGAAEITLRLAESDDASEVLKELALRAISTNRSQETSRVFVAATKLSSIDRPVMADAVTVLSRAVNFEKAVAEGDTVEAARAIKTIACEDRKDLQYRMDLLSRVKDGALVRKETDGLAEALLRAREGCPAAVELLAPLIDEIQMPLENSDTKGL